MFLMGRGGVACMPESFQFGDALQEDMSKLAQVLGLGDEIQFEKRSPKSMEADGNWSLEHC